MKPPKNFLGSAITASLLKGFAWSNASAGLLLIIAIAISPRNISLVADLDLITKMSWILAAFISFGLTSSLIFAAAYGLEMTRDTNYRINLQVQIAARSLAMAESVSGTLPVPPAQGATFSPYFAQPQPGQPLQ